MCPTGTGVFQDRGVLGQRCVPQAQDKGVLGQRCFRIEVFQDRGVSGQRCVPQVQDSGEPGLTLDRITACVKKMLPIPASPQNVWK